MSKREKNILNNPNESKCKKQIFPNNIVIVTPEKH